MVKHIGAGKTNIHGCINLEEWPVGSGASVVYLIEDQAGRLAAVGSEAPVGLERPCRSWFGGGEGNPSREEKGGKS